MSTQSQPVVKQERQDEAEIREMANKIMEANKAKMAASAARPLPGAPVQPGQMNILGFLTRRGTTTNPVKPTQAPVPVEEKKDDDTGKFGWVTFNKTSIPYIFRSGEKYCAVKMVETKVLNKYLNYLHPDIYNCTCIRSFYITEVESRLLNEINSRHCDYQFGREQFTQRDLVVHVNDAVEFYAFLDVCYTKLMQGGCGPKDRCGFIRINKESVVPYTVRGDKKYVPLFYFEGETDNLKLKADQLEGWDLSYLKFCCKVQGIRNELFASETCSVISLDDIKSYFPPGTGFEDYWPNKVVDSQLLVASKGGGHNGQWTRQPPAPPPIVTKPPVQARRSPAPVPQTANPLGLNAMQVCNGWAGLVGGQPTFQQISNNPATNQIIRQMSQQVSLGMQMTTANAVRGAQQRTHNYYTQNSVPMTMNSSQAPPPLVRASVAPHSLGTTGTYTTPSISQNATQSYMMGLDSMLHSQQNAVANYAISAQQAQRAQAGNVRSVSQQVRSVQQQQQQQQQQMRAVQQAVRPAHQQVSTARSTPQPPPLIPVNGTAVSTTGAANNNARYGQSTVPAPSYLSPPAEVIDLSSPPSRSPAQRTNTNVGNGRMTAMDGGRKLSVIPDTPATGTHAPFKVQKALVENSMIPCINMKPYVYTELLVTLPDLVHYLFPKHSVNSMRQVFEVLGLELFLGNKTQMKILRENGKCQSTTDVLPLVQIRDVLNYMPQIKYMCNRADQNNGGQATQVSKRQRTS